MSIAAAVGSIESNIGAAKIIGFGEKHQTLEQQSTFRDFFLLAIPTLRKQGFDQILIEFSAEANDLFDEYVADNVSLQAFRDKWCPSGKITSMLKDKFFESLKEFKRDGINVTFINKPEDPGRDLFMAERLLSSTANDRRAIFFCGLSHCMIRNSEERGPWRSAAEIASDALPNGSIISVAELTRSIFHQCNYDARIADMFKKMKNELGVARREGFSNEAEYVLFQQEIGKGRAAATEFEIHTITVRFKNVDFLYIDTKAFLEDELEKKVQGNSLMFP